MKLCPYIYLAGAQKGLPCNVIVRAEDAEYCYKHKKHADRMDKYSEKIEVIRRIKTTPARKREEEYEEEEEEEKPKKKNLYTMINESLEQEFRNKYVPQKKQRKEEEPIKEKTIKPKKLEQPYKPFNEMSDDELINSLERYIKTNKQLAIPIVNEMYKREIITSEQQAEFMNKLN